MGRAVPGLELHIDTPDLHGIGEARARAGHLDVVDDNGWLHTGDVGWIDDDGYLYLVARKGDKTIRGGENVYPQEVERVLDALPGVHESAAVGVADPTWGES